MRKRIKGKGEVRRELRVYVFIFLVLFKEEIVFLSRGVWSSFFIGF